MGVTYVLAHQMLTPVSPPKELQHLVATLVLFRVGGPMVTKALKPLGTQLVK